MASAEELLKVNVAGMAFKGPVWVAAGPPGRDAAALIECAKGGAGGLVAKTISVEAAKVPRPCMARPSPALAGSMLNVELWSDLPPERWCAPGSEGEYSRVRAAPECTGVPLIASLGYSASDVRALVPRMDPLVDAFEFSCHYTDLAEIRALASALRESTRKPVFAKLSPHGHDLLALARELRSCGVDGFVVMNSLGPCLALDVESQRPLLGGPDGKGWLSGPAIRPIALYWVAQLAKTMPDVPIIGVGGVATWRDAVEFFLAGAWAVQVCTAAIYRGPRVFAEINEGIAAYLRRHGCSNVAELRGRALQHLPATANLVPSVSAVDTSRCVYCALCSTSCVFRAITVDRSAKKWSVDADACYGCGLCTTVCPHAALTLVPRK